MLTFIGSFLLYVAPAFLCCSAVYHSGRYFIWGAIVAVICWIASAVIFSIDSKRPY